MAILGAPGAGADAPSGTYKDLGTDELWDYDSGTGSLTPTGVHDPALCTGHAESRVMVAGICVDVDATGTAPPQGYDARGRLLLVGEWDVEAWVEVGGQRTSPCLEGLCFGDATPGVTYEAFDVQDDPCADFPHASFLVAKVVLRATSGLGTFTATDEATVQCRLAM